MDGKSVLAAGAIGSLVLGLALPAGAAEPTSYRIEVATAIDAATKQLFRQEIDSYIRVLNEQLRSTLDEGLSPALEPRLELALDEARARG